MGVGVYSGVEREAREISTSIFLFYFTPPAKRTVYKGPGSTMNHRDVSVIIIIIIAFINTRLKSAAELYECFRKMKKSREKSFSCLLLFFVLNNTRAPGLQLNFINFC